MPMGLAVVRELGERGVEVHAIARSSRGVGLYSKWATKRYVRPPDADGVVELINRIAATCGGAFLIGVSEADLAMVRAAEDAGRFAAVRLLVAPARQLSIVQDKSATYAAARRVGLPVPFTWQPPPGPSVAPIPEELEFPCVLKWSSAQGAYRVLAEARLSRLKSEYCYTKEELVRALGRYEPVGQYPLVQSFCPGHGLGHMIFMHKRQALLRFQHRRVAEWPPEGGSSAVCETVSLAENRELFEKSVELLRSIEWEGPAMVEYRFDPVRGRAMLMEINGRFWGSLPLAYHAGAHFGWFTYAVLGLGRELAQPDYRVGLRCRHIVPETKRLVRLWRSGGRTPNRELRFDVWAEAFRYLAQFVSPRSRYYVFTLRDPMPFVRDVWAGVAGGRGERREGDDGG